MDRQTMELDLLEGMYPEELSNIERPPGSLDGHEDAHFDVRINDDYTLSVSLPRNYPQAAAPRTYLICGDTVTTSQRKAARAALEQITADLDPGSECLDLLIQSTIEALHDLDGECSPAEQVKHTSSDEHDIATSQQQQIKRLLLWSHHLLATGKRKDIVAWSKELALNGFSRPGYPGAIFVEGEESAVDEFVRRMKSLRWQALQVRAEEVGPERMLGHGSDGVSEVEGLGDIAEGLRRQGGDSLANLFLGGMKIAGGER